MPVPVQRCMHDSSIWEPPIMFTTHRAGSAGRFIGFIGMWQQESGCGPRRENGATVRTSSRIPHYPSLWGIAGTA